MKKYVSESAKHYFNLYFIKETETRLENLLKVIQHESRRQAGMLSNYFLVYINKFFLN